MSDSLQPVEEREVRNWDNLVSCTHTARRCVYRGLEDATWDLKTTLERTCKRIDSDLLRADVREAHLLREFKRRYHHYAANEPHCDDALEWLSLMQHFGAPTRLLDWTYSLPVATYFALRNASLNPRTAKPAAVWYMEEEWCATEFQRALNRAGKNSDYADRHIEDFPQSEFRDIFMTPPQWEGVALVNPFRLNVRLGNQQGVFTAVGDVRKTYMENLCSFAAWQDHVKKLVIHVDAFKGILEQLTQTNVTNAALFPGLDGFSVGLGIYHPILWK